ncbi:MAG: hypothetical protein ACRC35_07890 [Angustibacter sp.]
MTPEQRSVWWSETEPERDSSVLVVERPWAWCWWTPGHSLVDVDPEVEDAAAPRAISTTAADWSRVLRAVRYAVSRCDLLEDPFSQDALTVVLLEPLSELEHTIASAWVEDCSAVVYDYVDDMLHDGRHRLWLTRAAIAEQGDVPVRAGSLEYFLDAKTHHSVREGVTLGLEEALEWWTDAPGDLRDRNRVHHGNLARAHLNITTPNPVPPRWFEQLHCGDNELQILAELHTAGRADELLDYLPRAWRFDPGQDRVDAATVREMFRAFHAVHGFTIAGRPAPRPRGNLTLVRGASTPGRHGVSWTANPAIARHFAQHRQPPDSHGQLWKVTVPADRCLMLLPDEDEFVVDLDGLEDQVVEAPDRAVVPWWTRAQVRTLRRWHSLSERSRIVV